MKTADKPHARFDAVLAAPPTPTRAERAVARRVHERAVLDLAEFERRMWTHWRTADVDALHADWETERDSRLAHRKEADLAQWQTLRSRADAARRRWLAVAPPNDLGDDPTPKTRR